MQVKFRSFIFVFLAGAIISGGAVFYLCRNVQADLGLRAKQYIGRVQKLEGRLAVVSNKLGTSIDQIAVLRTELAASRTEVAGLRERIAGIAAGLSGSIQGIGTIEEIIQRVQSRNAIQVGPTE